MKAGREEMDILSTLDNERVAEELKTIYRFLKKHDNTVLKTFIYIKDKLTERYGSSVVSDNKSSIVVHVADTESIRETEQYILNTIEVAISEHLSHLNGFPRALSNDMTILFKTLRIDNDIKVIRIKHK